MSLETFKRLDYMKIIVKKKRQDFKILNVNMRPPDNIGISLDIHD